jgi:hypothetical protein
LLVARRGGWRRGGERQETDGAHHLGAGQSKNKELIGGRAEHPYAHGAQARALEQRSP